MTDLRGSSGHVHVRLRVRQSEGDALCTATLLKSGGRSAQYTSLLSFFLKISYCRIRLLLAQNDVIMDESS